MIMELFQMRCFSAQNSIGLHRGAVKLLYGQEVSRSTREAYASPGAVQ